MPLRTFLPALAFALACTSTAQPTWRFHLAFEDGTGARDTIWMVYDTSATLDISPWPNPSVDTLLGEGKVQIDTAVFNVWMYNAVNDSTKTRAYPYAVFPSFDGTLIDAINWVPPMTIRWDTSLFHAPYLPYGQGHFGIAAMGGIAFSQFDTGLGFGQYNMLTSDIVTIDFLWDYLFTFGVYFGPVDDTGILGREGARRPLRLWPSPAQTILHFQSVNAWDEVRILDLSGRVVRQLLEPSKTGTVNISSLSPGIYIVLAISTQNHLYHGKFQKID